jgi:predicted nucleotidyltransferase
MDKFLFEEIRELKRAIIPTHRLILFGSQARGEVHGDSDWDLLVLLNKPIVNFDDDYGRYSYPFTELGWKYGEYFSAKIRSVAEWEEHLQCSPFYQNVLRDGIEIL